MYYLYRHIRLDKNEPFYIGIGVVREKFTTEKSRYHRAYTPYNRNIIWKYIINKTEYEVEILYFSNSREEICNKEMEFVKIYGRIDLKTGTLANMTNGGEWGTKGHDFEHKMGSKNPTASKVLQYNLKGEFIKEWECCRCIKDFITGKIQDCALRNKYKNKKVDHYRSSQGFIWIRYYKDYNIKIEPLEKTNNSVLRSKKIIQTDLNGNVIKIHDGCYRAGKEVNVTDEAIRAATKSKTHQCRGFLFYRPNDFAEVAKLKGLEEVEKHLKLKKIII